MLVPILEGPIYGDLFIDLSIDFKLEGAIKNFPICFSLSFLNHAFKFIVQLSES